MAMATLRITDININSLESTTKVNKFEVEGLNELKQYIQDYLKVEGHKKKSCSEVLAYLEKAKDDDELLIKYIRARKNKPSTAWETILRYAENRFQFYPEIFPGDDIPEKVRELVSNHVVGILRHRDKFGRRIAFVDIRKWDTNIYSMDDLTTAGVIGCERFWKDQDVMENGIILIQNTAGFGTGHVKQHTLHNVLRSRNVFMFSFPVGIKGLYYLNVPSVFSRGFKMAKPLFPKKIRSRMFLYSANQTPTELFDIAPPEILPTWMGGKLSTEAAAEDITFYEEVLK